MLSNQLTKNKPNWSKTRKIGFHWGLADYILLTRPSYLLL